MSLDVMPAVEQARKRFEAACREAWDLYGEDYRKVKRPVPPKRLARSVGLPKLCLFSFPAGGAIWAAKHLTATEAARAAYSARLQVIRDNLLEDMRKALPGITIPDFEEAVRRSRYWEMECSQTL